MRAETLSRRTIAFVNIAHALDHFVLLIYPTAVIVMAAEVGLTYADLIGLAAGAFIAFGVCSLPMGWIAARVGRRNLLAVFFFGCALSCCGMALATSTLAIIGWLTVLGVFAAIYHPVGAAMLTSHTKSLGRDLGWNGVWGNLGVASASGITALIAASWGWQAAFVAPGIVCGLTGLAFLVLVPGDGTPVTAGSGPGKGIKVARPVLMLALFAGAIIAGGMTFNITTIALPKIIDERLGLTMPLPWVGSLATGVFILGALTQLAVGRLMDHTPLPTIFVSLAVLQPVGLAIAAISTGYALLAGLALAVSAIYGQVVVNDAMVARYVPDEWRAQAYGVRYFLGFTVSGFAAPVIATLHGRGGFPAVLWVAAAFGAAIFGCALLFFAAGRQTPNAVPQRS